MSGHATVRAAWFVAALLAAGGALSPTGLLPVALALPAVVIVTALAPGAWLARRALPDAPHTARFALALLLAPAVSGASWTLLRMALGDAALAARVLAGTVAVLSAWEGIRPRARAATPRGGVAIWVVAGLACATLAAAYLLDPILLVRSDGSFHAGVAQAVLRSVMPEDPFFAGLPLRYFWGLHAAVAAGLALVPALSAAALLAVANLGALVAALLATAALAERLGAGPRVRALAAPLLLAGTVPFGWVVLAARSLVGETRGAAGLGPELGSGADLALRALDPGLLHPSLTLPLDKFVVLTPFAWGLAASPLLAWLACEALAAHTWRARMGLALAVAATSFVHPVAGALLAGAVALAALVCAARDRGSRPAALGVVLAVVAGVLLVAPYLAALVPATGGGASAIGWGVSTRALLSVVWGGAALFPLAWFALARVPGPERALVGGMIVVLVLPALVLVAGGDNQSKALNLAFALAAAPAAVGLAMLARPGARRGVAVATIVLACGPALVALLWAYRQQDAMSADSPWPAPFALVEAIERDTARDAVLVVADPDTRRGAAPILPGATGRALLWSGGALAGKWGHDAAVLAQREGAAAALARGEWPSGPLDPAWPAREREVWTVVREDSAAGAALAPEAVRVAGWVLARVPRP
ncbi:MAG: hypothetical protein RL721_855 [Candidatus Eisenbacteria bacterium]